MPVNEVESRIRKQVENELAQKRQSINNSVATQKQAFDSTINQNKSYLDEQIKNYNTQKLVNDDRIATLQNRRGGFYSGGLDYQLASNQRNTESAKSGLTRDINSKNQEVLGRYNQLASQAAEQIKMLESQAPDKIRELVNNELARLRAEAFEREKWEFQKAQASRSRGGGGGGYSQSSGPRSKDESYADWTGYFAQNAGAVNNMGFRQFEQQLRNNKSMMNQIENQGYNVDAVIDAMYAGASNGMYRSKSDYEASLSRKQREWNSIGFQAMQ